ncbi:MAG: peroxiredoxin family protein [Pirellulales bacterium]
MNTFLFISITVLWAAVLLLGFLVLGALRALGLVNWRLDQLELTRPSRVGRDGLKAGRKAPDFTLPCATGREVSLHDFAGRKVLLVFTQSGCGPCHDMAPEFNRVQHQGEYQVLVVNNGEPDESREWAAEIRARFTILIQEKFSVAKRYEIFATPFAFVVDEQGMIASSGIVSSAQYLGYVLTGAGNQAKKHHDEADRDSAFARETADYFSSKEVTHV